MQIICSHSHAGCFKLLQTFLFNPDVCSLPPSLVSSDIWCPPFHTRFVFIKSPPSLHSILYCRYSQLSKVLSNPVWISSLEKWQCGVPHVRGIIQRCVAGHPWLWAAPSAVQSGTVQLLSWDLVEQKTHWGLPIMIWCVLSSKRVVCWGVYPFFLAMNFPVYVF